MNRLIAWLIDGDNISPKLCQSAYDFIKHKGEVRVKQVFGDFSKRNMSQWKEVSQICGIEPVQEWRTKGKHSTDMKMTF